MLSLTHEYFSKDRAIMMNKSDKTLECTLVAVRESCVGHSSISLLVTTEMASCRMIAKTIRMLHWEEKNIQACQVARHRNPRCNQSVTTIMMMMMRIWRRIMMMNKDDQDGNDDDDSNYDGTDDDDY